MCFFIITLLLIILLFILNKLINLNKKLNHFISFTESNPEPIIELNSEGKILYLNKSARNVFPFILENNFSHPLLKDINSIINNLNSNNCYYNDEINISGEFFNRKIYFINDDYYRIYFYNLTDLKKAELMLLEGKKLTENANKMKSNFLSQISHELRTPLNSIIGYAELLEADINISITNEDNIENIKQIIFASKKLLSLIDKIIKFSEFESKKFFIELNSIQIKNIINELLNFYEKEINEKKINVYNYFKENLNESIFTDICIFNQIIKKLIKDSIFFNTHNGFIEIKNEAKNSIFYLSIVFTLDNSSYNKVYFETDNNNLITLEYLEEDISLSFAKSLIEIMNGKLVCNMKNENFIEFILEFPIYIDK